MRTQVNLGMMQKDKKLSIVFVCTGNTCRSPMAEVIFKAATADYSDYVTVSSCGLNAMTGDTASENAVTVMNNKGLDLTGHRSRQINNYIIDEADYIICLSRSHYNCLLPLVPHKIILLGNGISDPYGGDIDVYETCAEEIEAAIDILLDSGMFLEIVPMNNADTDIVSEIESENFSCPWSRNAFISHINKEYGIAFVARYLNKTVGYICCDNCYGEVFVGTVAVTKSARGKGIGDKLIKKTIDYCINEKCTMLTLEVRVSNNPAINLYLKNGFETVGIRKNFYSKPNEDAYIMTKYFNGDNNENISN